MNKNDLAIKLTSKIGLSKSDTIKVIDSILESISESLESGHEVRINGFGTFSVTLRKASKGRNPRTGEIIEIPQSKQIKFKAGKILKNALNSVSKRV